VIGRKVPIDPVLAILGDRASADAYAAERIALGLDKPLATQFLIYVRDVLHGNLGISLLTSNPVLDDIRRVFPATLELATIATLIGIVLGVPLGVVAAVRHNRPVDHIARFVGLIGNSVPVFWLGLMGLLLFYARLHWVAGPGRLDPVYDGMVDPRTGSLLIDSALAGEWDVFRNAVSHIALPAAILGYYSVAYLEPDDALVHARPAEPGIHRHRAREGAVGAARDLAARVRQHRGAAAHRDRADLQQPARGLGADRDRVRVAGPRLVPDRRAAECRHERGARRDARDRRDVHHRQPADRRAVSRVRSACALRAASP
jgi:hypothetical protein